MLSTTARTGRAQFVSPRVYRWITVLALALLCIIIVSGAGVRLTGSGLGCPDWPNCEPGRLTPYSASDTQAMIEFVNRAFTGLVSLGVMLAVLGSLFRTPRRRDLIWLSVGLVAGVIGQIVLGGITVLFDLAPPLVAGHFVLSLILVWDAIVLVRRAWVPDDAMPVAAASPQLRVMARLLAVLVWITVIAGTVVTGSGPHAGDETAPRYNLSITDTARIHGIAMWMFLAVTIIVVWFAWRTGASRRIKRALSVLLVAIIVQAAIGYTQYAIGVPAWLVAFHIAGAVFVFLATIAVNLALTAWEEPGADAGRGPSEELVAAPA